MGHGRRGVDLVRGVAVPEEALLAQQGATLPIRLENGPASRYVADVNFAIGHDRRPFGLVTVVKVPIDLAGDGVHAKQVGRVVGHIDQAIVQGRRTVLAAQTVYPPDLRAPAGVQADQSAHVPGVNVGFALHGIDASPVVDDGTHDSHPAEGKAPERFAGGGSHGGDAAVGQTGKHDAGPIQGRRHRHRVGRHQGTFARRCHPLDDARSLVQAIETVRPGPVRPPAAGQRADNDFVAFQDRTDGPSAVARDAAQFLGERVLPDHLAVPVEAEEHPLDTVSIDIARAGIAGEVGPSEAVKDHVREEGVETMFP